LRLFKYIFKEAFVRITRLLKDIFSEVEAYLNITRLFEDISREMEATV
jgi:hypothetical protein